jgi:hypothetical protein
MALKLLEPSYGFCWFMHHFGLFLTSTTNIPIIDVKHLDKIIVFFTSMNTLVDLD